MYNFEKAFSIYKEDIIKHTSNLIAIKSVLKENEVVDGVTYPFGIENYNALKYYLDLAQSLGFKTKNIEGVCGHVEYGEGEEIFACLCHLDVVPESPNWDGDPFKAYVKDGLLYGRGSSDDKGPAVCSLYALKVLKDLNIKLKRKIRLIVGTDEESGSRGLKRYLQVEKAPDLGISPDADFPIIYAEKGITSFEIISDKKPSIYVKGGTRLNVVAPFVHVKESEETSFLQNKYKKENGMYIIEGISAHAMEPNNGKNAIKEFVTSTYKKINSDLIDFIYENLLNTRLKDMNLDITDEQMGDLTMNMGLISFDENEKLSINIRYPKNLNFDEFVTSFKEKASKYNLKVNVLNNTKVHYVDPESKFIKDLHASYIKYTNDTVSKIKSIGGGTYAREIKNGVAFGVLFPNEKEMAHEVNEYINLESLFKAGVIICDAMYNINK